MPYCHLQCFFRGRHPRGVFGCQVKKHMEKLLPQLYRYTFDPDPRVRDAMTHLWNRLITSGGSDGGAMETRNVLRDRGEDIMKSLVRRGFSAIHGSLTTLRSFSSPPFFTLPLLFHYSSMPLPCPFHFLFTTVQLPFDRSPTFPLLPSQSCANAQYCHPMPDERPAVFQMA